LELDAAIFSKMKSCLTLKLANLTLILGFGTPQTQVTYLGAPHHNALGFLKINDQR
jgi:hypothetical protein